MHTTVSSVEYLRNSEVNLTPAERLHELASIFADGILRLKTSGSNGNLEKKVPQDQSSDSCKKPLDVSAISSPHVSRG